MGGNAPAGTPARRSRPGQQPGLGVPFVGSGRHNTGGEWGSAESIPATRRRHANAHVPLGLAPFGLRFGSPAVLLFARLFGSLALAALAVAVSIGSPSAQTGGGFGTGGIAPPPGTLAPPSLAPPGVAPPGLAPPGERPIQEIVVRGALRIDPATIRSFLTIREGDLATPDRLDDSLKSVFRSGLFADVQLNRQGDVLVVEVVENPIINSIRFEGLDQLDEATLTAEIQLRPRVVYTRTRVQNDVTRMLEIYRISGLFAATVDPKIVQLPQNRVDLIFEVDEGPETSVRKISFLGNRIFDDETLLGQIQTEEAAFYKVFTINDTYDPDRVNFDRELLRRFYLENGYADFQVLSAVAELSANREDFFITFTVEEGQRYRVGEVRIDSQISELDPEVFRALLLTIPGEFYSSADVEASVDALTDAAGDFQFAFVDIRPRLRRNTENLTIDIIYEINEAPRVFVERISINGNTRTLDRVIRREFTLVEGDPFNNSQLRRSEARINNLGFFSAVNVSVEPGSTPDRSIIRVNVAEQSTGEISLGAGFSTTTGPLGNFSITERNLLGRGQPLRLQATVSALTNEFDISFTEPFFLGKDLSAGIDLFNITRNNQDFSSFDTFTIGAGIRFGYTLAPRLRQNVSYRIDQTDVNDVDDDASIFIQAQEGTTVTSEISQSLTFDQLDSRIDPTDGFFLRGRTAFAGLGGDVRQIELEASGRYFIPVTEGVVASAGVELGQIVGLGEDVRIDDRFFVGGDDLRGFAVAGVGPRDTATDDALGGNTFLTGTLELTFPLGLPESLGFSGRSFVDFGTLFDADDEGATVEDPSSLRASVGVGIGWRSPFGPVGLDLAFPALSEDFDETELVRFSFGTTF